MSTHRVIIVHSLEQACAALDAAQSLNIAATLQTHPDALLYAGAGFLVELFGQAKAQYPDADATFIIDCADARPQAISVLQLGHSHIRSNAVREVFEKLASIAQQHNATIVTDNYEALDLHKVRDTKAACETFLKEA